MSESLLAQFPRELQLPALGLQSLPAGFAYALQRALSGPGARDPNHRGEIALSALSLAAPGLENKSLRGGDVGAQLLEGRTREVPRGAGAGAGLGRRTGTWL